MIYEKFLPNKCVCAPSYHSDGTVELKFLNRACTIHFALFGDAEFPAIPQEWSTPPKPGPQKSRKGVYKNRGRKP